MSPKLGVLLLSGVRHQAQYAPLLASHPRPRLVALADEPDLPAWMDTANAALADHLHVPHMRDIDAGLARPDVDLVVVCPEPTRHARLAARAARAGKHVLVDKPMACTVADGHPIAVTASHDHTVRVWDLVTGSLRAIFTGYTGTVNAVACTMIEGRPVAVTVARPTFRISH